MLKLCHGYRLRLLATGTANATARLLQMVDVAQSPCSEFPPTVSFQELKRDPKSVSRYFPLIVEYNSYHYSVAIPVVINHVKVKPKVMSWLLARLWLLVNGYGHG